jgi:ABC-type sugar transport system, permease component
VDKKLILKRYDLFDVCNITFLVITITLLLYPFIYVFSTSLSEASLLVRDGNVNLFPRGFSLQAYVTLLDNSKLLNYYLNSVMYAVLSAVFVILISSLTGYALSVKSFFAAKPIMVLMVITMFFNGGLIPYYMLIRDLHGIDKIWVMFIPGAINVWNCIIFKTFFQQLPSSLKEAAFMDGANDIYILFKIILPISKPLIATFAVFSLIATWNEWFTPLLFFNNPDLQPAQMLLRKILVEMDAMAVQQAGLNNAVALQQDTRAVKAAAIVITSLPIVCVYPFFQKYFTKGILVGSLKG